MRMEFIPRQQQMIIFDKHQDNYDSSAQIFLNGDMGVIYGLNGTKFYEYIRKNIKQLFAGIGVEFLLAYVRASHMRLMKRALDGICTVEVMRKGKMAKRNMVLVMIEKVEQ